MQALIVGCTVAGFVLAAAGADLGDLGDRALLIPGEATPTCAKDAASCEAMQSAIRKGYFPDIARDAETRCVAHPGCFDHRSNCIPGYAGPRPEGVC